METLLQDLRYGLRVLLKKPGFTAVAVLSLALGIGANSAVFSLVDALLLRPLPVEKPDRLVALTTSDYHESYPHGLSYRDYVDYREGSEVFSGMTAYAPIPLGLGLGGHNERVWGLIVSGDYFSVLGINAALGRTFLPEEDQAPGTQPVAVISYGLWQRRFGADPAIAGKVVTLNGHAFTVVGVTPKTFTGLEVIFAPDIFVPIKMHAQAIPGSTNMLEERAAHELRVWARLKPGVSFEQAQAAINIEAQQLEQAYPESNKEVSIRLYPQWEARFEAGTGSVIALGAMMVMALVALVLLIACANIANMLLSRVNARRKEIAIRLAMGASRARLIRQLLTEGLLVSLMGGTVAMLLALWATDILASIRPGGDIPLALDITLDGRVLAFTGLIALLTCVIFGLAPALQASRPELVPALKGEEMTAGHKKRRFSLRNLLVVSQVAMSLVLLICAGLFLRSLSSAQAMDLGLRSHNTLLGSLDVRLHGYDELRGRAFYRDLRERARSLPGVESVSIVGPMPLDFSSDGSEVLVEGRELTGQREEVGILQSVVGLDYFQTLGTPLVSGREFTLQDDETRPGVVIINETMAERFWPGQDAVGKRIRLNGRDTPALEVVGIAKDGKYRQYFEAPRPYMYLPHLQHYRGRMTIIARTVGDPATVARALQREVSALDPNLPLFDIKTIEEFLESRAFLGTRLVTSLLGVFGLVGLMLAAVGIYGVMSYSVTQRTREIGIRMALGAQHKDVIRLVVRQGMVLTLIGVALGLASAFALTRLLESMLYGVSATDPVTFGAISLALAAVAFAASLIPARRAARVDPMIALRHE